jgi:DNA-binding FrmR family transcriptional regulator
MEQHQHKQTKKIVDRLSRIEGHVHAVKDMVKSGKPCADILIQISAVRSAIDKVGRILLEDHIESCLLESVNEGDVEHQLAELKKALSRFIS